MAKKSKDNIELFYDYGIDVDNRILYMGSEAATWDDYETGVDFLMAERVIKGLTILDLAAPSGDKEITIVMNNVGGDVYHGLAIYDAIKSCKNDITIMVYGHAMSMGSIILQAAGQRVLSENATIMIHAGSDGFYGHARDFQRRAKEGQRIDALIDGIFLDRIKQKNPKYTMKDVQKLQDFDTFMSAEDAVKLGLADKVLKGK